MIFNIICMVFISKNNWQKIPVDIILGLSKINFDNNLIKLLLMKLVIISCKTTNVF
jgi:hypothetical protein